MGSGAGFVLLAFPVLLASFERERGWGGGVERARAPPLNPQLCRAAMIDFLFNIVSRANISPWK